MTPRSILVAYDFSDPSKRALGQAADIARRLGATLTVVHVHPGFQVDGPWPPHEHADRYERFLEAELDKEIEPLASSAGMKVQKRITRGADVVTALGEVADEVEADIICVASSGKGAAARALLGSVSQALIRTCKRPVLTVH